MYKRGTKSLLLIAVLAFLPVSEAKGEMIHLFARKGDVEKVMAEISKGVAIDLPSTRNTTELGVSPLFVAAKFGQVQLVEALIEAGADFEKFFDAQDGGDPYGTPLHVAAAWGQADVVRILLDAGAEVDPYHRRIGTPLHRALEAGRDDVADLLREAGAAGRTEISFNSDAVAEANPDLGREIGLGCGFCHAIKKNQNDPPEIGPSLWGIVGRPKGAIENFEYSPAMRRDQGEWSYAALNSFLAAPYRYLPGTEMHFAGIEDRDRRAAVIGFLSTLSDDPVPLP